MFHSDNSRCLLQVAFQGTVVTIENFLAWKATFDLEMTELRKKKQKEDEQGSKAKLTGTREPQGRVALPISTVIPRLFSPSI